MPSSSRRRATFLRATISPVCAGKRADTARRPSARQGQGANTPRARHPQRPAPDSGRSRAVHEGGALPQPRRWEPDRRGPARESRPRPARWPVSARRPGPQGPPRAARPHLYVLGFEDNAVRALPDATEDAVLVHVAPRRPDLLLLGPSAGQSVRALPSNNASSSGSVRHVTGKTWAEPRRESASPSRQHLSTAFGSHATVTRQETAAACG